MAKRRDSNFLANVAALGNLISTVAKPVRKSLKATRHEAYLRAKYPEPLVQQMVHERVWQGQTSVELTDCLGTPASVDRKQLATRKREIWKYHPIGKNRYALRVTLDDDVVVGWDSKG